MAAVPAGRIPVASRAVRAEAAGAWKGPAYARAEGGRPELLVLAAALLFGTTGTAQALGPEGVSGATVGAARLVVGGSALAGVALTTGGLRRAPRWPAGALGVSALGIVLYQACFFAGVARTGVALGTIVALGSAPAATGALAWLAGGPQPGRRWALATTLAVGGCALLVLPAGTGRVDPLGVALALGAGCSYALYTVTAKDLLDRGHSPSAVMGAAFGLGAVVALPILAVGGAAAWLARPEGAALALYLGLVPTALAYALFARGLRSLPAARVATLTLAEPLTATVLGVALLSERPGVPAAAGALLVLCGLVLAATERRPGTVKRQG